MKDNITEFFSSSNLNNKFFYIHCPFIPNEEKAELCENIVNNNGVS